MGGGRSCSVVNCTSRTSEEAKHFYHFPSDQTVKDVWITFTRRGSDYAVRKTSYICEDHFDPSCFVFKKKQICLAKNTVPTIFHRMTPEGESERIVLTFDRDVMHYVEEDTLLNPVYDKEKREEELIAKRDRKIQEIGNLCRFCLEDRNDESLIEISKLREYSINPTEVMPHLATSTQFTEIFNKSACEECFQHIIIFDGYRKRCRKAQELLISALKNIEKEIAQMGGAIFSQNEFMKTEMTKWSDDDDDDNNQSNFNESRLVSPVKSSQNEPEFHQIIVKQENKDEPMSDDDYQDFDYQSPSFAMEVTAADDDDDFDEDFNIPELPKPKPPKKERKERRKRRTKVQMLQDKQAKKEVTMMTGPAANFSTRYEEETLDLKEVFMHESSVVQKCNFYECFFCKLKFGGKTTYASHVCTEKKEITCMVPNCGKIFTALSGFNTHITKLHKLPGITRHFCKFCKLSKTTTKEEFLEHYRKCEINAVKMLDSPVTCEWCSKVCPNMKAYEVHMMFHTGGSTLFTQRANASSSSRIIPKFKQKPKGVYICETCGKDFAVPRNLKRHIVRLHEDKSNAKVFTCDKCGKTKKTREEMQKHIRCVHYVNPSTCPVCGKTFGNRALLQAHQSRTKHRVELQKRVQQEAVIKMLQPDYFY